MYDELIAKLRGAKKFFPGYLVTAKDFRYELMPQDLCEAADIIEEMQRCIDGIDADNDSLCEQLQKSEADNINLTGWLAEEHAKHQWISVEERLPKHAYGEGDSVLTVSSLGSMRVLCFDGGNWCYPTGEALTTARKYPITHWMPLPEPPKGDE